MIARHRMTLPVEVWRDFCDTLGIDADAALSGEGAYDKAKYPGDREAWRLIVAVTRWPRRELRKVWRHNPQIQPTLFAAIAAETIRLQVAPYEMLTPAFLRFRRRCRLILATVPLYRAWRAVWPKKS